MSTLAGRAGRLKQTEQRASAFVAGAEWYSLRVAPSCPPDRRLHIRGGRLYAGYNSTGDAYWNIFRNRAWTVPDLVADLADLSSVTVDVAFTNADWFQFFLLELWLPAERREPVASDWTFNLHGTLDEFETAAEAEAWLHSNTFQHSSPWNHGSDGVAYPLCGLVLRNNGSVGAGCQILPIDYMNRGRSYMWPTDMRPLQDIWS